ncbi:unnamed protein product [Polarella glacialis]|uniref:Uncharacterized protein n=2 Tax=Polarella glacialis TaxID=89957 RepID=A0A813GTA7_POLGL|nr:unnamed protein product [Polarella glacialis]
MPRVAASGAITAARASPKKKIKDSKLKDKKGKKEKKDQKEKKEKRGGIETGSAQPQAPPVSAAAFSQQLTPGVAAVAAEFQRDPDFNISDEDQESSAEEAVPEQAAEAEGPRSAEDLMRDEITQVLVASGGECRLSSLETQLGLSMPPEVHDSFIIDMEGDAIALTGKQMCKLLEAPSFNVAAIEESFFDLGEEVLRAGLDFGAEDRFRELFDDLLAKREEVRAAVLRRADGILYAPGALGRNRQLPPMLREEEELLNWVLRAVKAQSRRSPWVPMSSLLEDINIRRGRAVLPDGLPLWEWLSLRCKEDMSMVTDGSDLLLQYLPDSSAGAVEGEARRSKLAEAVRDTLFKYATEFPTANGLSFADLEQLPAVARLKVQPRALQRLLSTLPQMFQIYENSLGPAVRLAPGTGPAQQPARALIPGELPTTMEEWELEKDVLFRGMPSPPEGWIRVISKSTGCIYFANRHNPRETRVDMPKAPAHKA